MAKEVWLPKERNLSLKKTDFFGFTVYYQNKSELDKIVKEIPREYYYLSDKISPRIIDCGSHIGLTPLWFKFLFPEAKLLCFEPNPENFTILEENIRTNGLRGIKAIRMALSAQEGEADLFLPRSKEDTWTWNGSLIPNIYGRKDERRFRVPTGRLSSFLSEDEEVDFLKMDIEGKEEEVISEVAGSGKLGLIREMAIEFHGSRASRATNNLEGIIKILEENSFFVEVSAKNLLPPSLWKLSPLPMGRWIGTIRARRE